MLERSLIYSFGIISLALADFSTLEIKNRWLESRIWDMEADSYNWSDFLIHIQITFY